MKVYKRAWVLFNQCSKQLNFHVYTSYDLPVSVLHLAAFVGFLSQAGYSPSSIVSFTSCIGYVHKLAGVENPVSTFLIQKLLSGATKLKPTSDSRLPITTLILNMLVNAIPATISNSYKSILIRAMLTTAFYGLMRIGEITSPDAEQAAVKLDQIKFTSDSLIITITKFKHNHSRQPLDIVMPRQDNTSICPVHAMYSYLQVRGYHPGPLFCFPDGKPVSRSYFAQQLKNLLIYSGFDTTLYKSHSLRIGGASYYAELGYSDTQIRELGRWKSDSFKIYIRSQRIHQ